METFVQSVPVLRWWWDMCMHTIFDGRLDLQVMVGLNLFLFGVSLPFGLVALAFGHAAKQ